MNPRPLLGCILLALAPSSLTAAVPEGAAANGKFTRFEEDETGARLQTGIGSYRNQEGVTVDLIGAIHIADKAYYERLNRRFTRYDALLYEMVGVSYETRMKWRDAKKIVQDWKKELEMKKPKTKLPTEDSSLEERVGNIERYLTSRPEKPLAPPTEAVRRQVEEAEQEEAAGGNLSWLHPLYDTMEKSLGLTGQMRGIDYSRKNFIHADMTLQEFSAMQKEKNESFLTLWWKSVVVQIVHPEAAPEQPGLLKIMESLCRQDGSAGLRRIAARTFGSVEGALSGLESEDGTVILTERNKVALGVLQQQIKLGRKNLAIFYGAAHLADMEKRLLSAGFVRCGGEWFNAWDMPEGAKHR